MHLTHLETGEAVAHVACEVDFGTFAVARDVDAVEPSLERPVYGGIELAISPC